MKRMIPILVIIAVGVCAYSIMQANEREQAVIQAIAQDFAQKYNRPADTFIIDVTNNAGGFAKGLVRFTDEQGGGMWFAANTQKGWELVFDGNGIVPCDAADKYAFPADIIPQCIDTTNNNELVQRKQI